MAREFQWRAVPAAVLIIGGDHGDAYCLFPRPAGRGFTSAVSAPSQVKHAASAIGRSMIMEISAVTSSSSSTSAVGAYYRENGYVIAEKLVAASLIDDLLDAYRREILPSKSKFYRQNTNRYEANVITEHGYVANCFLDIHSYRRFDALRRASLEILFHPSILAALNNITGFDDLNLMQSMLFDANTATPPHQDWWYLDSVPGGNLLAAWIALEDIHEA